MRGGACVERLAGNRDAIAAPTALGRPAFVSHPAMSPLGGLVLPKVLVLGVLGICLKNDPPCRIPVLNGLSSWREDVTRKVRNCPFLIPGPYEKRR